MINNVSLINNKLIKKGTVDNNNIHVNATF